jgi:hypothetical protein
VKAAVLELEPAEWRELAAGVIAQYAELGIKFSNDDIRQHLPEPHHSGAWGGAFSSAAAKGIIREAGTERSRTKSRRNSKTTLWVGVPIDQRKHREHT